MKGFTYKNKIIEYNCYYYSRVGECKAQDIWIEIKTKSKGYDVLSVWEMDYKENPNAIIEQCYNFVIS